MTKTLKWGQTPWDNMTQKELVRECQRMYAALVGKFQPPEDAGWRKIDKAIAALREALIPTQPAEP